ncbi:MAG: cob(I)yrinic acid a,c-diamide adenosyltransferase [Rikenellaceae bacterium]|nr:cob(I)yrinic acid a,c-diamide adenosyltransferase [Rikenellaceae bacterium]
MKIYTKRGDDGTTSLIGGERVPKYDPRVEAYGSVDELMAFTALLGDMMRGEVKLTKYVESIDRINCALMSVASLLAVGEGGADKVAPLDEAKCAALESEIDQMQSLVQPITKFTIPGGCRVVSQCHVCRTVCRRAERAVLRAGAEFGVDRGVQTYLNRLSDWFYLLGRVLTEHFAVCERLWIP